MNFEFRIDNLDIFIWTASFYLLLFKNIALNPTPLRAEKIVLGMDGEILLWRGRILSVCDQSLKFKFNIQQNMNVV